MYHSGGGLPHSRLFRQDTTVTNPMLLKVLGQDKFSSSESKQEYFHLLTASRYIENGKEWKQTLLEVAKLVITQ